MRLLSPTHMTVPAMETLQAPNVSSLDHLLPQEPLLMMGAGPVPIPHKVAYANSISSVAIR